MPGKNTQDWTDDAAFWDDAWADMEQRLDGKNSRKAWFVWVRWAVLLTLLLVGVVASRVLNTSGANAPAEWPEEEPAAEVSQPVAESSTPEAAAVSPTPDATAPQEPENAIISLPVKTPVSPAESNLREPVTAPLPAATAPAMAERETFTTPAPNPTPTNKIVAIAPNISSTEQAMPVELREVPVATERIASSSINRLGADRPLPDLALTQSRSPLPLFLTTGGSFAQGRQTPGYFVGLGTVISPRGRISFPVSVRYRKDFFRLGQASSGGRNEDLAQAPVADQSLNAFELLIQLPGDQTTALTTTGIELATGLQYRLGSRFNLGLQVGGEYLLTADGVIDAIRDEDGLSYTFNNRETINANIDPSGGFNNIATSNRSFSGVSSGSGINRFRVRTGLEMSYQVSSRFALQTGVSRIMTPTYRNELLRVRPTQFSLGLQYKLR